MAACTDSHRQHVRGFVHKSPGRHSFQGFVQAGSNLLLWADSRLLSIRATHIPVSWIVGRTCFQGGESLKGNGGCTLSRFWWFGTSTGKRRWIYSLRARMHIARCSSPCPNPRWKGTRSQRTGQQPGFMVSSDQNISKEAFPLDCRRYYGCLYEPRFRMSFHIRAHSRGVERYVYSGYMRLQPAGLLRILSPGFTSWTFSPLPSQVLFVEWLIHVFFCYIVMCVLLSRTVSYYSAWPSHQYWCSALYSVQLPVFRVWFSSATIIMLVVFLLLKHSFSVQRSQVFVAHVCPVFSGSRRYFYPDYANFVYLGLIGLTATYQLWARLTASLLVGSVYVRILSSLSVCLVQVS